ncbi:metalloregulator ArsR/SmtB family transcription factor [Streptomyces sp. MST-110588]|uniref:ArsR/SmtB family transcription factor n=1 Tax=Streptomyces sp. MST-110588 TaxID=2833628 RepID=UPI001F5C7188|nr:metalloregulator ArsR/SmtB family transcription factor [Streptomyces sp. MST-110588]UNO38820.1 helix-turn-helix transcriptional regulator [Streptomyces sp. MST-110588]
MLRLYFTGEDLSNIRLAPSPDPMWEVLHSAYQLHWPGGGLAFGRWRRRSRLQVTPEMRPLLHLIPSHGSSPDFLTPAASRTLDAGIEALHYTPRARLRQDLEFIARERRLPTWTRDLAEGRVHALRALSGALRSYHDTCLAPYWRHICSDVARDRDERARVLRVSGPEALLTGLPGACWKPPVLEIDYPFDHAIDLAGRGLLLVPTFFGAGTPTALVDPDLPPVLCYPIEHALGWTDAAPYAEQGPNGGSDPLIPLMGAARARILHSLTAGACSTGDLARRSGIDISGASRHTVVLQNAGLVSSRRDGKWVVHRLTPLGRALTEGRLPS